MLKGKNGFEKYEKKALPAQRTEVAQNKEWQIQDYCLFLERFLREVSNRGGPRMLLICPPVLCRVLGLSAVEHTALFLVYLGEQCLAHVALPMCTQDNEVQWALTLSYKH